MSHGESCACFCCLTKRETAKNIITYGLIAGAIVAAFMLITSRYGKAV